MNTKPPARVTIFVRLLNEGVPVARPVDGEAMQDDIYLLLPVNNYDPEEEQWEFPPGTLVRCEKRINPDLNEEVLLAIAPYTG